MAMTPFAYIIPQGGTFAVVIVRRPRDRRNPIICGYYQTEAEAAVVLDAVRLAIA